MCDLKKKVFYFSGEETSGQILERFKRLNLNHDNIDIFHERNISTIGKYLYKYKPDIVIIDSIQTSQFGEDLKPGSVNTIKEVVNELLVFSKSLNISIIIIGHVTKGGDFSGPKLLEHMVDIYLTLTLDKKYGTKKLVAEKNRFGLVGNPAFFSMTERGLVKAPFPGEYVFEKSELLPRGSVLSFFSFGPRYGTFLVNVMLYEQFEKIGKRVVENFNLNRLHSICAQAESVFKINLKKYDIFVELPDIIDKNQRQVEVGVVVGILGCYFKKQFMNTDIFYGQTTLSNRVVENNHQNEISKCIKEGDKIFGPSEKIEPFRISNIKDLKTVFEV